MSVAAALKGCHAHDLGTVPENIPGWVKFTIPLDKVQSQLAAGRVRLSLDEILGGLDPDVRRMFSSARAGLMVDLEMNAVFHALSEGSMPSPVTALKTEQPSPASELPAPKQQNTPPPSTAADPFAPAAEKSWKSESLPKPPESAGMNPFWGDNSDLEPPPTSFLLTEPAETSKPVSPFPAFQPQPEPAKAKETSTRVFLPAQGKPVVIPANPATGAPEVVSSPPVAPAAPAAPRPAAPRSAPVSSGNNSTRSLLLTVLLGSSDAEDVGTFVHLTRQLPGVAAAVCLHQGKTLASEGDGSTGAERFLREAAANAQLLPSLAALTGIEDSDTLHVQSGHGEATFCLHDEVVFAVLHNPEKREATLREKITLLGRELAGIVREHDAA